MGLFILKNVKLRTIFLKLFIACGYLSLLSMGIQCVSKGTTSDAPKPELTDGSDKKDKGGQKDNKGHKGKGDNKGGAGGGGAGGGGAGGEGAGGGGAGGGGGGGDGGGEVSNHRCLRGKRLDPEKGECVDHQPGGSFKTGDYDYIWIQKGYEGSPTATKDQLVVQAKEVSWWLRAITTLENCPDVLVNKKKWVTMTVRMQLDGDALGLPRLVCQYQIQDGETLFQVWSAKRKDPINYYVPRTEDRLFIIGDTGTEKLTDGEHPILKQISEKLFKEVTKTNENSKKISAIKDNAILHLGDYVYTPKKEKKDETWREWESEFFYPMSKFLEKTAFIFVRGNGEECGRPYGNKGWFYYLDPASEIPKDDKGEFKCESYTRAYPLKFGDMDLAVLDSAEAKSDPKDGDTSATEIFAPQLQSLADFYQDSDSVFIISHRPFWSYHPQVVQGVDWGKLQNNRTVYQNISLQMAYDTLDKKFPFKHVVSGHYHAFDVFHFNSPTINQIIVGNSGVATDQPFHHVPSYSSWNYDLSLTGKDGFKVNQERKPTSSITQHGYAYLKKGELDTLHLCLVNQKGCENFDISNCGLNQEIKEGQCKLKIIKN